MNLAILECDDFAPELVRQHGSSADWITTLLSATDPGTRTQAFKAHRGELPDITQVSSVAIMGSRASVNDPFDWVAEVENFVRVANGRVPVIGICFGHQIIHKALGGTVSRSEYGFELGYKTYDVLPAAASVGIDTPTLRLHALHQDQVIVPAPGSETLAKSRTCKFAITRFGQSALTLQAHPEHTRPQIRDVYAWRQDALGKAAVDSALRTLDAPGDERRVSEALYRFLSQ